jgi:pyruvate formate lyase activating enzyme
LRPGQRGFCFVRENVDGGLSLTTYGRSSGFAVDPIEKKPLYHFLPGSSALSFGTAGCNLACRFCQNWEISAARDFDRLQVAAGPAEIAAAAVRRGCHSVAYTYNDPIIFAEYALDTAIACREAGIANVAVTAGYICDEPRRDLFGAMDAANIDLKSFNPDFYRRVVGGRLEVILETLAYVVHETTCWVEITTLLIPGLNDSDAEIRALTEWVGGELGSGVPLHFTAFHPDNRLRDVPRTPLSTLQRARQIALDAGLQFVYTGNVVDEAGGATHCPNCGALLIRRRGYEVEVVGLAGGTCTHCGTPVPGRWDAARLGKC